MTLWSLLLVHFAALAIPGVDNFVVSQTSASKGSRAGFWAGLGITCAVLIWATLTVAGLSYLVTIPLVHLLLTLFGASYLLWLAWQLVVSAKQPKSNEFSAPALTGFATKRRQFFIKGLFTNFSNPKAVIYFGSIFTVFLAVDSSTQTHAIMIAAIVIESFLWFWFLSTVFALSGVIHTYEKMHAPIEYSAAVLFVAFAVYMLWMQFA